MFLQSLRTTLENILDRAEVNLIVYLPGCNYKDLEPAIYQNNANICKEICFWELRNGSNIHYTQHDNNKINFEHITVSGINTFFILD